MLPILHPAVSSLMFLMPAGTCDINTLRLGNCISGGSVSHIKKQRAYEDAHNYRVICIYLSIGRSGKCVLMSSNVLYKKLYTGHIVLYNR